MVKAGTSKPDAARKCRNPVRLRRSADQADTGNDSRSASVVVARNSIEEPLDTENKDRAYLIIETDLATATKALRVFEPKLRPVSVSVMLKFSQPAPMLGPI